ncbi:hypothetical protein [Maribacter luteus]|uniref:hypothetical protein n=1 Tax=Maribacter luteus TaxID=2594478 RepID=UPI002491B05E|nr:hypothetical protein [Maribacter luteus]
MSFLKNKISNIRNLVGFVVMFSVFQLSGQNENKIWYFGENAGLDFNTSPPTVLTNSAMIAPEGCSSIADTNGDLLFYTNGETIYNRNHQPMVNGIGLNGNVSSSQSVLIV